MAQNKRISTRKPVRIIQKWNRPVLDFTSDRYREEAAEEKRHKHAAKRKVKEEESKSLIQKAIDYNRRIMQKHKEIGTQKK